MAPSLRACAAAATAALGLSASRAFVAPGMRAGASAPSAVARATPQTASAGESFASGCSAVTGIVLGAHAGLAAAMLRRSGRKAEAKAAVEKAAPKEKYVESAVDARLFEEVFHKYTVEYLKGPMYWEEGKLQSSGLVQEPGKPLFMDGKMTSMSTGPLQTFSSNELAFLSLLFFAIGLYGYQMFNIYDPQWPQVQQLGYFPQPAYIVETLCLPISFTLHVSCYIQKENGK